MKIEIKKKGSTTAILISFGMNTSKVNTTEKSKFFTELYGRDQTIKKEKKKYFYRRVGIMDEVPHISVDNSVFIVAMEQMKRMEEFFDEWEDKVMFKTFPVILDKEETEQLQEVPVQDGFKLIEIPKRKKVV